MSRSGEWSERVNGVGEWSRLLCLVLILQLSIVIERLTDAGILLLLAPTAATLAAVSSHRLLMLR